jgi:hypothetical protein
VNLIDWIISCRRSHGGLQLCALNGCYLPEGARWGQGRGVTWTVRGPSKQIHGLSAPTSRIQGSVYLVSGCALRNGGDSIKCRPSPPHAHLHPAPSCPSRSWTRFNRPISLGVAAALAQIPLVPRTGGSYVTLTCAQRPLILLMDP